jgi:predicted nucleotidyltransferase
MPTALELTRQDWKRYVDSVSRRGEPPALTPEEQQAREQLWARVHAAAALLKTRFAARRVVLFGSLAHTAWFSPDSDVDLAVEGLAGPDYWQAWKRVEEVIGDRPVDLIEMEAVGESLRRAIERYGVEL